MKDTHGSEAQTARIRQYAQMLASVSVSATKRLDDVRLPLHILLENHFGELNENQEEMLAAARAAAELAEEDLTALRTIAELDLGTRQLRRDRIFPADMLHAILPMIHSVAERLGVVVSADIAPLVPPVTGDAPVLQEALLTLLRDALVTSASGAPLQLALVAETGLAIITLNSATNAPTAVRTILAHRVVQGLGGSVQHTDAGLRIELRSYGTLTTGFSK